MTSHPTKSGPTVQGQAAPAAPAASGTRRPKRGFVKALHTVLPVGAIGAMSVLAGQPSLGPSTSSTQAPSPIVEQHQVQWWAAFKLNAVVFPTVQDDQRRGCTFGGGTPQPYAKLKFSQQYIVASSQDPAFQTGVGLLGVGPDDPLGQTFSQIYNHSYHYVVWNDQLKGAPQLSQCGKSDCASPWGHSKGLLAWDDAGDGVIVQVTTPSWPGAASQQNPRTGDGNTLGCVTDDNVEFSQDFFALKLTKDDLVAVLHALANSSVVTDPKNPQLVNNGGPDDVRALVNSLGVKSSSQSATITTLSSGVRLISKPSQLHAAPWQLVSAELGGVPLKVANWWTAPAIPDTDATTDVGCRDTSLAKPGAVVNAKFGQWNKQRMGLQGGSGPLGGNHAKIGVSTDPAHDYAIFGDMNQQGSLSDNCTSSQDGRGGMFFVVESTPLANSVRLLLTDPTPGSGPASVSTSQRNEADTDDSE